MSTLNQYAPTNGRIVDDRGRPSVAFQIWLRDLWLRTGGASALSYAELEALIAAAQAAADAAQSDIDSHEAAADPHSQYLTDADAALAYQPLDSDLTAIAALTTTAYGRSLLTLSSVEELNVPYATRYDQIDATTAYLGDSLPGVATSAASWRVRQLTFGVDGDVDVTWADGDSDFDNVWDDRASLTYS